MPINKFTTTDAFVITDLEGAAHSAGPVRVAKKVLQGSSAALARTATYAFAARHLQVGGAAAGISAEGDDRPAAIAAFVAEVAPRRESGELILDPASGITADELAPVAGDPRAPLRAETVDGVPLAAYLDAVSAVAAAEAAHGPLDGATATVEAGPTAATLIALLAEQGVVVTEAAGDGIGTAQSTLLFCGARQGLIDGAAAATLDVKVVVPTGCQPVSAKGLAVLRQRGTLVLADFVTASGHTFAGWPDGASSADEVVAATRAAVAEAVRADLEHPEGPFMGACTRAESFLATWQETLPFGRPLA